MAARGAVLCRVWRGSGEWRKLSLFTGQLLRHVSSSAARNRPLEDGKSYQVLTSDGKTIVCYHSPKQVPFSETKPLRRRRVWKKETLTPEEATLVRKLRHEDGFTWTMGTLSRFFNVSPVIISRVAPATQERKEQVQEERKQLSGMRPHKRKLYLLQRQKIREDKIKEVIASRKYPLPPLTEH